MKSHPVFKGTFWCLALWCYAAGCDHGAVKTPGGVPSTTLNDDGSTEKPSTKPDVRFTDRAATAGVSFSYQNGSEANRAAIIESLGGGGAIFDFDRDQALDVFLIGGGRFSGQDQLEGVPSALYRNQTGWQFQAVTAEARMSAVRHYTHGAAVADVDGDGFDDVLVTGYGGLQFWHNEGDGTFRDTTDEARLTDPLWSSSAAFGDINGDGHLDLYVAHYVNWSFKNDPYCPGPEPSQRETCSPRRFEPLPHIYYESQGDGTFADRSVDAGLRTDGKGLGVMTADVDLDGKVDIYVANDTVPNFLYRNQGNGKLEEIGHISNTALSEAATADGSMGVGLSDYNHDGLPDIWVANYERESFALYRNEGNCFFLHVSQPTGVTAVGSLFVGFGTVFCDLDRDGFEDIWVTNGHVIKYPQNAPVKQVPLLFMNRAGKRFENAAPQAGDYCNTPHLGRGAMKGDLDADGDLDLVTTNILEPASLLENNTTNDNGWLAVRCIGTRSNRSAIGTRLSLKTSAGLLIRQVTGGGSYLSHSDSTAFWGLPNRAKIESLTVYWPSGSEKTLTSVNANATLTLIEPAQSQ